MPKKKEGVIQGILKSVQLQKGEKIFDKSLLPGTVKSLGLLYGGFMAGRYAMATFKAMLSEAERKCGAYDFSPAKKGCLAKEKIRIYTAKIKYLTDNRKKCKNEACLAKVDKLIREAQIHRQMAKNELDEYREWIANLRNPPAKQVEESKVVDEQVASIARGIGSFAVQGLVWSLVDAALVGSWKKAELLWSQAARKCAPYGATGPMRDMCISKYKLQALNQKRDILKQSLNKCRAAGKPEKCIKVQAKLSEIEGQIKIFNDNIKIYQQGAIEAAKEDAMNK